MALNPIGAAALTPFSPPQDRAGKGKSGAVGASTTKPGAQSLTPEQQREVAKLKQRDAEVRRHEQAHVAAGGQYVTGGPTYSFATGPDGRRYATGGEVSIDVSPARDPEATIRKMQVVRRAALAPAEPSGQDRQVAAQASQNEIRARQELAKQGQAEAGAASTAEPSGAARRYAPATDTPEASTLSLSA
jgi:hypothetical protein